MSINVQTINKNLVRRKEIILAKLTKMRSSFDLKIKSLEEELIIINKMLRSIEGNQVDSGKETSVPLVPLPDTISAPYIVRKFIKNYPDGINVPKLKELCKIGYESFSIVFDKAVYPALSFMVNNGEVEKLGIGTIAIYKPTDKLKPAE